MKTKTNVKAGEGLTIDRQTPKSDFGDRISVSN